MLSDIIIYPAYYIGIFVGLFYLFMIIKNRKKLRSRPIKEFPFVSVVIPVYNKESVIKHTVNSVLNLDYPKDKIEIICINDGSTDESLRILKEYKNIRIIDKKNEGKSIALNQGIKFAKGKFIMCLDADTIVQRDLLKKCLSYFNDKEVNIVIPTLKPYKPKNLLEKIQLVEYSIASFTRKITSFNSGLTAAPGCSIFRAEFLKKSKGFEQNNITEDFEMALRAQSKNVKISMALDTVAYTNVPKKFKDLYRQRIRWCYGNLYNLKKYKRLFNKKYGDLGVFFLPLILISISLGILGITLAIIDISTTLIQKIHFLSLINFDYKINLTSLSIINFIIDLRIILGLVAFSIAITIFNIAKKYTNIKEVSLFTYLSYVFIYSMLLIGFWIISAFYFIAGKQPKW